MRSFAKIGARSTRARSGTVRWRYPGTAIDIVLPRADRLLGALDQVLMGWTPDRMPAGQMPRQSVVRRDQSGYATRSSYLDETLTGLGIAGAACAVIADLAQDFFETRPGSLALHCGAFALDGRLIAVTGPARAGKSTLVARMCCETGVDIYCDDVLPVFEDGQAHALGIAPRLRLPLPAGASDHFRGTVEAMMGPCDRRYGYVCTPAVVPHGTRAALSVLLILDRRGDGPAALHDVTEDEALRALLAQNMTDLAGAEPALTRMSALLSTLTCLRLVYSDLEVAVRLLRQAFGRDAAAVRIGAPLAPMDLDALPDAALDPARRWQRDPQVAMQRRADAAFLWMPGRPTLWHMNTLATAIWTLLELPGSADEITATLREAFPEHPPASIAADVAALLQALAEAGMILPDDSSDTLPRPPDRPISGA